MYIIVNVDTWQRPTRKEYKFRKPAQRMADRLKRDSFNPNLEVMTIDEWMAKDYEVEVTTIFGRPTTVRRSQVGSCCDPSTERYWCM